MHRPRLLPVLFAAAIGLAACSDGGDPADPAATASEPTEVTAEPTEPASESSEPASEPDGTASPSDPGTVESPSEVAATGDCSAAGMSTAGADFTNLPAEARATAEFLLDAAARCDEQLLATAAEESSTTLTFGGADPYEFFGLPEGDEIYATIVTLLTRTPWAAEADDSVPATFAWPRVHTGDWADSDEAWQEVVDAGLLTAEEAAEMRAGGSGYLGWRLGISGDGSWQYFVAGD